MNTTKIQELLLHCISNQMVVTHEVDLKKFAELIVKECVYIADEYVREGGASQTAESLIGKRIKQHFGVE
jgi:ABC-type arginine transport system ATPase subunit